ncbi:MAG: hypothetical protein L0G25_07195, partial [Psychrobacter sp.]|nr:hypothetical protein [Psychrobacter sp.]
MDLENQDKLQSIIDWAIANEIDEDVIPRDIEALSKLTMLELKNYNISELPESLGSLTNLNALSIIKCPLINFPACILNLKNLYFL